jgi:hypothetical protein
MEAPDICVQSFEQEWFAQQMQEHAESVSRTVCQETNDTLLDVFPQFALACQLVDWAKETPVVACRSRFRIDDDSFVGERFL